MIHQSIITTVHEVTALDVSQMTDVNIIMYAI